MLKGQRSQIFIDLAIILAAWATLIAVYLLLGRAGYGTGLAVTTMGEDQNWIALLRAETPHAIANNFWRIDGRNPLSPWFYILAKPLILSVTNGIALLQYAIGLWLAMATYFMLRLLTAQGGRWFAVSSSAIIAVNYSNAYFDHIIWNFQLALCCTIMAIVFYILFLRSQKRSIWAYGISLSFWCISFYSYTLQSGAIVAITVCQLAHLTRTDDKNANAASARSFIQALKSQVIELVDLVPYIVVFGIFLLTWVTATPAGGGFPYQFSFLRLLSSLQAGIIHPDIALMYEVLRLSSFRAQYWTVGMLAAAAGVFFIARSMPRKPRNQIAFRYLMVILVVCSIALPTLLLESGGSDWAPGTRWRMIYQMTTPVLIMAITGCVLSFFRLRFANLIFQIVSGVLLAVSIAFSLAYNERQVSLTRSEATVRQAMHEVIVERQSEINAVPLLFVMEMDDSFQWLASETLRSVYMRTWFPGVNAEYRILPSRRYIPSNPTKLIFGEHGISVAGASGVSTPYHRVVVLHAFGRSVTRRFSISREEVVSHNGVWLAPGDLVAFRRP